MSEESNYFLECLGDGKRWEKGFDYWALVELSTKKWLATGTQAEMSKLLETAGKGAEEKDKRIAKLEAQSQWVSVDDRLPMLEAQVLVWNMRKLEIRMGVLLEEKPTHEDTFNSFNYWDDYYQDGQGWDWQDITHWMPLPENPADSEVCDE